MGVAKQPAVSRRPGRHWVFMAAVAPLSLVAWWLYTEFSPRWQACVDNHPDAADAGFSGPCGGTFALVSTGGLTLTVFAVTVVAGLFVGLTEGKHRHRFAHGRRICAVIVGVCLPPTLLVYAAGYGIGRLLPAPRQSPVAVAHQHGWDAAVRIYQDLVSGRTPAPVQVGGFLRPEPAYLDVPMGYSRYYGMNVTYQPGSVFAMGSASFVTGAMIGGAISNMAGQARAANLARAQWREHLGTRVVLTESSTWCSVQGRWLAFDHAAVMEYYLDGANCVLTFADVEPLRLAGPAAACHAVLFAYLRGGDQWRRMPFLRQIDESAYPAVTGPPQP